MAYPVQLYTSSKSAYFKLLCGLLMRTSRRTPCSFHKHPVYFYLQRNHQSSPETVLSCWNLGVGHTSLRQNKPHSTHGCIFTEIHFVETAWTSCQTPSINFAWFIEKFLSDWPPLFLWCFISFGHETRVKTSPDHSYMWHRTTPPPPHPLCMDLTPSTAT